MDEALRIKERAYHSGDLDAGWGLYGLLRRAGREEEAITLGYELWSLRGAVWWRDGKFQWLARDLAAAEEESRRSLADTIVLGMLLEPDQTSCPVEEPVKLGSSQPLTQLNFFTNRVLGDPEELAPIAGLRGLRRLRFNRSPVSDEHLAALTGLGSLRELDLTNTLVTDAGMPFVAQLSSLRRLRLDFTGVGDGLQTIFASLPRLLYLGIKDCPIGDEGLTDVGKLAELRRLDACHTGISDSGLERLAELPGLELLNLYKTRVTDGGLHHLARMPSLRRVSISGPNVSDAGLALIQSVLPDVEFVEFGDMCRD